MPRLIFHTLAALFLLVLLVTSAIAAVPPVGSTSPVDHAVGQRLDVRLRAIDGLHGVHASVIDGIALLDGQVVSEDQRKLAEVIAAQTQGVTKVENRVELSSRLRDRFGLAWQAVTEKLVRLLAATPLLLVAIGIVLLSTWLGRVIAARMNWLRRIRSPNPYMDGLVRQIVQWAMLLAGLLVALDLLGATSLVGAVLGSAGVVGLVLGFAFKDIAENYIAGILLSLRRPFSPGDHLVIDRTHEGKVVALTSRATLLMTMDGNQVSLPNALVFKSVVLNYSRNPRRRFDFVVPLHPTASIRDTQRTALAAISAIDGVLAEPPPSSQIQEFQPDRIAMQFLGWVDQQRNDLGRVRSEAMRATKAALDHAGVRRAGVPAHVANAANVVAAARDRAESAADDTSVNRDLDQELTAAQQANEADNLLDGKQGSTPP
jgi:small conductance mechanosensitive channel